MNGKDGGSNRFELRLPLELQILIQEDMAKNKQFIGTSVLRALTEYYKDRLTPEEYQDLITRYSMTAKQQKAKKQRKKKEREVKAKKRLKQRDRALDLKERELRIREANTGIREDKHSEAKETKQAQIERLRAKRKELLEKLEHEKSGDAITRRGLFIQRDIKKIDKELEALGVKS